MPSRSILLAALAAATLALVPASGAQAKIVVFDASGHPIATPVRGATADQLLRWSDDGTQLLVLGRADDEFRTFALDPLTGTRTFTGTRSDLVSAGPGGRWVAAAFDEVRMVVAIALRDAGDRAITSLTLPSQGMFDDFQGASAAWSADGARVVVSDDQAAVVLDTATGATLRRIDSGFVPAQALSPDGGAVLVSRGSRVVVIDVATGARRTLGKGDYAQWSPDGRTVLVHGTRAWVSGRSTPLTLPSDATVAWSADGSALTVAAPDACRDTGTVRLLWPGRPGAPVTLGSGSHQDVAWSPDGSRLAVELGAPPTAFDDPDRRGARHPWPKRIATDYEMGSARGDRAVRRAVGQLASDLRGGMGRARVLRRLGQALERIGARPWGDEVWDTAVGEAIAGEVSAWLRAAGFREIEGRDELEGDVC